MARVKPYANYDVLYDLYVKKRKSAKDIGEEFGVTEMTVWNHLKKFDLLKFRGKGRTLGSRNVRRNY